MVVYTGICIKEVSRINRELIYTRNRNYMKKHPYPRLKSMQVFKRTHFVIFRTPKIKLARKKNSDLSLLFTPHQNTCCFGGEEHDLGVGFCSAERILMQNPIVTEHGVNSNDLSSLHLFPSLLLIHLLICLFNHRIQAFNITCF